jgi:hypothetical protein
MMDEKEERILEVVSNIEVQLWIYQDLNNPKSEKFWLSQYVSKEPQFYEKVLQAFKDDRRYIVLSKLIEVYELDNKKCISPDKLFRMDYKPVYEFLLKYQQDIQNIGKEKPAAITESHQQIEVIQPATSIELASKQKEKELVKAQKNSQRNLVKKLLNEAVPIFAEKVGAILNKKELLSPEKNETGEAAAAPTFSNDKEKLLFDVEREMKNIAATVKKMDPKSRKIKDFLVIELDKLLKRVIDEKTLTYQSMQKKDFAELYFWPHIKPVHYKSFYSFYHEIFHK